MEDAFAVDLDESGLVRVDQRDAVTTKLRLQEIDRRLKVLDIELEATAQRLGVVVGATALARSLSHLRLADREMEHPEHWHVEAAQKVQQMFRRRHRPGVAVQDKGTVSGLFSIAQGA
ncbi:MAG: hypothetical protein V3T64_04450, partial [Myxococcota bacterium]